MGAGKSSLGRALAEALDVPFLDLDASIEEQQGMRIAQLMFSKGELHFRQLERSVLETLLSREKYVLALGGGTPCYYNNMDLVNQHSTSFYLRASPAALAQRLANTQPERPLIAHLANEELIEFIAKHLFERSAFYEEAQHILDAQLPIEENMAAIQKQLDTYDKSRNT